MMAPSLRIPQHLQPYVCSRQKHDLTLLTGILGASTNWLLIRYLCSALERSRGSKSRPLSERDVENVEKTDLAADEDTAVVLGLDLNKLGQQRRFAFVDGLSQLFLLPVPQSDAPLPSPAYSPRPSEVSYLSTARAPGEVASRATAANSRVPPPNGVGPSPAATVSKTSVSSQLFCLTSCDLTHTETVISHALAHVRSVSSPTRPVLLLLDSPDLLLAASTPTPHLNPSTLAATILSLRQVAHSAVVTLAADAPLVSAAAGQAAATPLEAGHGALVVGLTHVADIAVSLRLLDTGFAADVSGVMRITRGGGSEDEGEEQGERKGREEREEKELLYFIGGDGGVKVFERGAEMSMS